MIQNGTGGLESYKLGVGASPSPLSEGQGYFAERRGDYLDRDCPPGGFGKRG